MTPYEHTAAHRDAMSDALMEARARIAELEEFIADSECTCLPYAKLYDGMCQRCLHLKGDSQTTRQAGTATHAPGGE